MKTRSQSAPSSSREQAVTWRALLCGLLLLPLNALWLVQMELVTNQSRGTGGGAGPFPTTFSLFANVVCFLVALMAVNAVLRRVRPRWVFSQSELLVIYVMLTIGSCITSVDFAEVLFGMLGHPTRYATASNRWADLFLKYIPHWFQVSNKRALQGWYTGVPNPYLWDYVRAWLLPLTAWGLFILALLFTMLCLNVLVRRQWTQHEKLSYPIIQLPLHMTDGEGQFFHQKLLWGGFCVAGGICLLNGLAYLYPSLPTIPVKIIDVRPYFPNKPWNAIGWTPVSFYPFAIGLGFLLPTDLLFSCWFFYFVWKAERILGSQFGYSDTNASVPYVNEQSFGAYMGIAAIALWGIRSYLAEVVRQAWRNEREHDDGFLSYRNALLGAAAGIVFVIGFFWIAGLPLWACVLAFAIYFAIAVSVTRMRAELGPPAHDLHNGGPDYILTAVFGSSAFSAPQLTVLAYFFWFNRAYRSLAMPFQLEAMKIGERKHISVRGITLAISLAITGGLASGFWALYSVGYHNGLEARMVPHFSNFGAESFNRLASWIQTPRERDTSAIAAIVIGLTITLFLQTMPMRFAWWPFHPLGLAVSGSYSMNTIWLPLFIAWVCKTCLLRYGGLALYRRSLSFFFGLILGDYVVGCAWPIVGWLLGVSTYSFQQ